MTTFIFIILIINICNLNFIIYSRDKMNTFPLSFTIDMTTRNMPIAIFRIFGIKNRYYIFFIFLQILIFALIVAHPTNPVECCADANPKTMLPNDT